MVREPRHADLERGVVLHTTKFGERQMVVHMITRSRGRYSFVARLSGRGGEVRRLFAPLSVIEFAATYSSTSDLGKLSAAAASPALFDITSNIIKCSVALFAAELLYRVVRNQGEESDGLYDFVERSVLELEKLDNSTAAANFHLYFMVRLSAFLGYSPRMNWGEGYWFDIKAGEFVASSPVGHSLYMEPRAAEILYRLLSSADSRTETLALSGVERSRFLASMVDYYAWHTDTIHSVRSIAVLSELFA